MSKKATEFQKKEMSKMYRGKEIFKPLNTGWIDEHVACVREWVANIFFYRKGDTTIMIDAGCNYDRLEEKMGWLGIDPKSIRHIHITHQDTDHVGAVESDSPGLFRNAKLYVGEIEDRYLTGKVRRKVIYHLYRLPQVTINNPKQLLKDGDTLHIGDIKIQCFLVSGHTWGHMVYLVDGKYLFPGDTLWFGVDGDYCPPLSSGVITTFFGTMSGSGSSVAIVCTHHCIGRYSLPQFFPRGGTWPSHTIDSMTELYHFTLSHYGLPALCPTLKRHCWSLTLQGLDTGGLPSLTRPDSHRLYACHRTGARPLFARYIGVHGHFPV